MLAKTDTKSVYCAHTIAGNRKAGRIGLLSLLLIVWSGLAMAQQSARTYIPLNENWYSTVADSLVPAMNDFSETNYATTNWKKVNLPHNWDGYEGYRRKLHGNRHGYAWYRKTFALKFKEQGKRYFLFFEGVGSYATVWLNEKKVGAHAGGRTTFTIDVTDCIKAGKDNILAVQAGHPAGITDLPWVCGGCSAERGFSEGSQPMGIFRPVQLIITNNVHVVPFGVHAWNDTRVSPEQAVISLRTTIRNDGKGKRLIEVVSKLVDKAGKVVALEQSGFNLDTGLLLTANHQFTLNKNVHLWSPDDPYLYKVVTILMDNGLITDSISMPYGIRWINWTAGKPGSTNQFYVNGKPVFINGIAEYEHLMGNSHAFTAEQIKARALQIRSLGFNAFRDAHQPHNLRYQQYWDEWGILWWTQLSAHVWYDTPGFRERFKELLKEWVIERRNSPSVVLWGLQNESKLPADFAAECTKLIRELDPTASTQRKVTTCNGGEGTDWDVPQNWTGTYGGDPATYASDVKRQNLIGEYGAWRTIDLHTEGPFVQNGPYSEDRMTQLMEQKIRLAESVKDSSSGHFFWLYTSHDNPGRMQGGEGLRELDRIGPVNYKGLLTPWEEPLDVFYMFRSNYAPKETSPMAYIVSHTWPQRWITPGIKDSIIVYSNCDEIELFNDVNGLSLGKRTRKGIGTHFQWDGVHIQYNILYAVGYVNGKAVAKDHIVLHYLPQAPHIAALTESKIVDTRPAPGYQFVYRVNAGGPAYKDKNGYTWDADIKYAHPPKWDSYSWTNNFPGMPDYFASQRQTYDAIQGTMDGKLFQDFRYGREKLSYSFPLDNGEYLVDLYFIEPWWGTGGGMDCTGYRLFDVAINDSVVIKDLDIWKEAGHDAVLKKTVKVKVLHGKIMLSFPTVKVGQAIISAIAITTKTTDEFYLPFPELATVSKLKTDTKGWQVTTWLNLGDTVYTDAKDQFTALPSFLYGTSRIRTPKRAILQQSSTFIAQGELDVYIALPSGVIPPSWMAGYEHLKESIISNTTMYVLYKKRIKAGQVNLGIIPATDTTQLAYLVMVNKASSIEPAYDLKPVNSYKAAEGTLQGVAVKQIAVNGKEQVVFTEKRNGRVDMKIVTGVADEYSLTLKYNWPANEAIKAQVSLLAADGTLMKKETVTLNNTKTGKWNYITTSTGSMINAGNYIIRLEAKDAQGLSVGGVDVQ